MTLAGRCHAHNVGVSLLAAVGLTDDWVASSEDEYVALAVAAASDIPVRTLAETCDNWYRTDETSYLSMILLAGSSGDGMWRLLWPPLPTSRCACVSGNSVSTSGHLLTVADP